MKGTTLIELMLALFISTLIISSLISIYLAAQTINQQQIAISTVIENSNMAFNFITSDIKAEGKKQVQPYHSIEMKADSMAFTVHHDSTNEINSYFIGKTTRKTKLGDAIFALYSIDNKHQKKELVEGINDMQIQYSVVVNDQIMNVAEKEVNNQSKLIGISMMLSLLSTNTFFLQKNEYLYVSI